MGILLPIILYPIMMIGMDKLAEKSFDVNKKNFSIVVQDDGNSQVRELLKGQKNITIKDEKDAKRDLIVSQKGRRTHCRRPGRASAARLCVHE